MPSHIECRGGSRHLDFVAQCLRSFGAQFGQFRCHESVGFPAVEAHLPVGTSFEQSVEGVIIFGADRVEFMIVTAGTGDRQTEEGFAGHIDAVVEAVGLVLADVDGGMDFLTEVPKSGTEYRFVGTIGRVQPGLELARLLASSSRIM